MVTNHLDDVTGADKSQFVDFVTELLAHENKFKAGATSLEVIRNPQKYIPADFNLGKLELEDFISVNKNVDGEFRFDILWRAKRGQDNLSIFIDTKNYSSAGNMFKDLGQFKAYLRKINNFDELYIIQQGGRNISEGQMIARLKKVIKENIDDVFSSIWENERLRNNLFKGIKDDQVAFNKFSKDINDSSYELFNILLITK